MGNNHSHIPYLVRQISQDSGKDEASIFLHLTEFQKECPSGHMTPQNFSRLYDKVNIKNSALTNLCPFSNFDPCCMKPFLFPTGV